VGERAQSRWRDRLLRALARWIKAWAESILAQAPEPEEQPPAPPPAPREVARARPPSEPPPQWVRDVQSLQAGPPADWVERVRRGAPQLLSPSERAPSRRHAAPPSPPIAAPAVGKHEAPRVEPPLVEEPRPRVRSGGEDARGEAEERPSRPSGPSAPEPVRQPYRLAQTGRLESRTLEQTRIIAPPTKSTLAQPESGHAGSARPPATSLEPREGASTAWAEAVVPSVSRQPAPSAPAPTRGPDPVERREWHADSSSPPSGREPAPGNAPSAQPSLPWPPLPKESLLEAGSELPSRGPWTELPDAPPTEPSEGAALLLQWERLERLDREQRGE
jgi:hypothetical protein